MIEASPTALAPAPRALATTSNSPATTGVPSVSPVAAAASAVTPPAMSVGPGSPEAGRWRRRGRSLRAGRRHRSRPAGARSRRRSCRRCRRTGARSGGRSRSPCKKRPCRTARRPPARGDAPRREALASAMARAPAGRSRADVRHCHRRATPRQAARPHVERLDREERPAAPVDQVETVAMAGAPDRRHRRVPRRPSPGIRGSPRAALLQGSVHVALDMAGRRGQRGAIALARASWRPVRSNSTALMTVLPASRPSSRPGSAVPGQSPMLRRPRRRGGS